MADPRVQVHVVPSIGVQLPASDGGLAVVEEVLRGGVGMVGREPAAPRGLGTDLSVDLVTRGVQGDVAVQVDLAAKGRPALGTVEGRAQVLSDRTSLLVEAVRAELRECVLAKVITRRGG